MNASKTQTLFSPPNAPQLPGLSFRGFGGEADFAHMAELINVCNRADKLDERTTAEEVRNNYTHLTNCDLDSDFLVAEIDGQMVGYSRVWWVEETDTGRIVAFHIGVLHPDWRRKGFGSAMLAWNQQRLREKVAELDKPKIFRGFFDESQPGDKALLQGDGYQAERFFFEMKRDLSEPIPEPQLPEGLEIRPVEEAHYRPIWDAKDEAFRDHWGHSPSTEESYQRWLNSPHFEPSLWQVAWDGDQVAGMILNVIFHNEDEELDRKWGWTDPICVRRPWRRRGLASNLLYASMRLLKDRGREWAALGVDVDNPLGALKLYENAGYKLHARFETWQKTID
jgi:GNAT superfamily N-acetyltransferase